MGGLEVLKRYLQFSIYTQPSDKGEPGVQWLWSLWTHNHITSQMGLQHPAVCPKFPQVHFVITLLTGTFQPRGFLLYYLYYSVIHPLVSNHIQQVCFYPALQPGGPLGFYQRASSLGQKCFEKIIVGNRKLSTWHLLPHLMMSQGGFTSPLLSSIKVQKSSLMRAIPCNQDFLLEPIFCPNSSSILRS